LTSKFIILKEGVAENLGKGGKPSHVMFTAEARGKGLHNLLLSESCLKQQATWQKQL
jgi:hypothetical protein